MESENNTIINYIDTNFSPTQEDISNIAKHYENIGNILGSSTLFQSGSYPRNTAIKPINDLDIITVLPYGKSTEDVEKVLNDVYTLLSTLSIKNKLGYHHLKLQKSSIGIYFHEDEEKFSVDVVPAIETNKTDLTYGTTIYNVPEIQKINRSRRNKLYSDPNYNGKKWIYSAPKAYKEHSFKLDEYSHNNFRYVVRFIKQRKRNCKKEYDGFCLKSFHIEQLCGIIIQEDYSLTPYWQIFKFFDKINNVFQQKKQIKDLAYEGVFEDRYIDDYVENPEKNTPDFREYLRKETIRVKSLLAQISTNISELEIIKILDQIFKKKEAEKPTIVKDIPKGPRLCK